MSDRELQYSRESVAQLQEAIPRRRTRVQKQSYDQKVGTFVVTVRAAAL